MEVEPVLDHQVRLGKSPIHVAVVEAALPVNVAAGLFEQQGGTFLHGFLGINDWRERLVHNLDFLHGIFSYIAI